MVRSYLKKNSTRNLQHALRGKMTEQNRGERLESEGSALKFGGLENTH